MCECGCSENETRYTLQGPAKSIYVVSLYGGCTDCDAPPGVTIEQFKPKDTLYEDYKQGEFVDGPLEMIDWNGHLGAAITTGFVKHEFIKTLSQHLIGVDSGELGEKRKLDKDGAEIILEEMYEDALVKPHMARPSTQQTLEEVAAAIAKWPKWKRDRRIFTPEESEER